MDRDGDVSLDEFVAARLRKAEGWRNATLENVDTESSVITVQPSAGESGSAGDAVSFRVEPKAVIVIKGSKAKLGELKTGQTVYLFRSHDKKSVIGVTQR
jgi:hypothetical protein